MDWQTLLSISYNNVSELTAEQNTNTTLPGVCVSFPLEASMLKIHALPALEKALNKIYHHRLCKILFVKSVLGITT